MKFYTDWEHMMVATLEFHGINDVEKYKAIQESIGYFEILTLAFSFRLPYITSYRRGTSRIKSISTYRLNYLGMRGDSDVQYQYHQVLVTSSKGRYGTIWVICSMIETVELGGELVKAWIKSEELLLGDVELINRMRF
ncbi:hypothetical protein [Pontibacter litorisediminis]|uniref:hypothetical protein n=1 Tax=Pontibacter litorisediminis TaxID=1846260 RepID=UPI0023EC81FE|nr:hypothetical protein [Pontibacter litorisediminis]